MLDNKTVNVDATKEQVVVSFQAAYLACPHTAMKWLNNSWSLCLRQDLNIRLMSVKLMDGRAGCPEVPLKL